MMRHSPNDADYWIALVERLQRENPTATPEQLAAIAIRHALELAGMTPEQDAIVRPVLDALSGPHQENPHDDH